MGPRSVQTSLRDAERVGLVFSRVRRPLSCQRYTDGHLQRQVDLYRGAVAFAIILALKLHMSAVPLDKLLSNEEADTGSNGTASGEEGFANLR